MCYEEIPQPKQIWRDWSKDRVRIIINYRCHEVSMWPYHDDWTYRPVRYKYQIIRPRLFDLGPAPIGRGGGVLSFSAVEVRHLAHAVLILSLAFALFLSSDGFFRIDIGVFQYSFALSIPVVLTGFLLHEIGHKYMAQRFGCWSEFRADYKWLLLSLVMAPLRFLFMAPGAVVIAGYVTRKENGIISFTGPMVNFAIAVASIPAYLLLSVPHLGHIIGFDQDPHLSLNGVGASAVFYLLWINLVLAAFNLLPFGPLDGAKVLAWKPVYLIFSFTLILLLGLILSSM